MNGEKILWTGRQNMKAALMSAIINFFLLAAAVWLLVNRNNLAETAFSGICQTKQIELVTKKKCWQGGYDDDFTFMKNLADADEAYRILRSVQDRVYAEMGFAVSDAQKNGETYRMRSHEEQHRRYMLRWKHEIISDILFEKDDGKILKETLTC